MSATEEPAYFRQRARQERLRAAACTDRSVARIHLDLAAEYERRASHARPTLELASE